MIRRALATSALAAAVVVAGAAAAVMVSGGTASDSFALTVVSENTSTITFSYPAQSGYGYLYSANGNVVSRTYDSSKTQVKFAKASSYEVASIVKGTTGSYPVIPPPTTTTTTTTAPPTTTEPPPTTTSPPPSSTISVSQFNARAVAGATVENVTVTGGVSVRNPNVTLRNVTVQGSIDLDVGSTGSKMLGSSANALYIWGPDNILIDGNTFDGHNNTLGGKMWDENGDPPRNITITNNIFRNQQTGNDSDHSQAIFVGYSDGVLISGNTFVNNGSTADIFFSWWADLNPSASRTYPRNVCVKGNSFSDPNHLHYFAINFRSELQTSSNIKTDPNEPGFSTTSPQFNGTC